MGAFGAAAVLSLAREGAKVLGIDQFDPPHNKGSTHGETRATRIATFESDKLVESARRSIEICRRLEDDLVAEGLAEENSPIELFRRCGGIIFGRPNSEGEGYHGVDNPFLATLAAAEQRDVEHDLVKNDQIRTRWPMFNPGAGEEAYFEPEAGVLFPERIVEAQLSLAARKGAWLAVNETARRFESGKNAVGITTVTANGQTRAYEADKLIITAGPWVQKVLPQEYKDMFTLQRLILFWYGLTDAAKAEYTSYRDMPRYGWAYDTGEPFGKGVYGFPALDGPEGGIKIACDNGTPVESPEAVNRHVSKAEKDGMYESIHKRMPGLSRECLKATTCLYTMTKDNKPLIGFLPDHPGVLAVSACNGAGFKHSLAFGEVAAQLVLRGSSDIDLRSFGIDRLLAV
jgi:sarcosine oxidase